MFFYKNILLTNTIKMISILHVHHRFDKLHSVFMFHVGPVMTEIRKSGGPLKVLWPCDFLKPNCLLVFIEGHALIYSPNINCISDIIVKAIN